MATNLPAELTSFIGREDELERLGPLLGSARLLTLTGAGGSGKTRLTLKLATDHPASHPDGGVWLVELAPVLDPGRVVTSVATAFAVREGPRRSPATALCRRLRERRTLLVLDGCEHVVDACARLVEALLSAPPTWPSWRPARSRWESPGRSPGASPACQTRRRCASLGSGRARSSPRSA